jgi:murein DD-endopeptidase MepM/ murein hydrolase activator NlpD
MYKSARLLSCLAAAFLAVGCATTEQVADTAWRGTKNVAATALDGTKSAASTALDGTKSALSKLARYTKVADLLKKNHDSANHDDTKVVEVLKKKSTRPPAGKGQAGNGRIATVRSSRETFPVGGYKGSFGWPVEAGIISSEYGSRWGRQHKGIDIAADTGEPILAAADGQVIYAGNGLNGYGNVVILRHDARVTTLYAHNSALRAQVGETVKAGQVIALLGSTGHSTGPHCHFEIRDDSEAVNPRLRLTKSRIFEQQILVADAGGKKTR